MTGPNLAWMIAQLDEFIEATVANRVPPPPGVVSISTYSTARRDDEIVQLAQVVEQILNRILPTWRTLDARPKHLTKWSVHREAAIRARVEILRREEIRANIGDDAPEISASNLHPWVWSGATSLWQSGHYRSAVEDAAKKVNAETQNKVARREIGETKLFQEVFSEKAAEPGKSRLRRMTNDGSETYKSLQRGAMAFAEGIFAGIRNPFNHEDPKDIDEQVALEYLAALSVLARWVDESAVEAAK